MSLILVAADAVWVRDLVQAACTGPDQRVIEVSRGQDVRPTVAAEQPDVVVLDMQIGNMGGIACAIDLRLESGAGRLNDTSILLLLDREERLASTRPSRVPRRLLRRRGAARWSRSP